jgi:hypothetical protein
MGSLGGKLIGVLIGVAVAGIAIGFYVAFWAAGESSATAIGKPGQKSVDITLQTVAAVGPKLSENPDWVSYLLKDPQSGDWKRSTVWKLPAHTLVHVTIYNFDGASGLRNPFLAQPQGLVGREVVDGKPVAALKPEDASHTFAIPAYDVLVPVAPVADDAKNQCEYAPCTMAMAHRKITFSFRTGDPGHIRWQCFVPCAAGFLYGFGGPMQSIGYMDGFIDVV